MRQELTDAAYVLTHRAGGWLGQRIGRLAGPAYLPSLLRGFERSLPHGSLVQRRFHLLCSVVGDLNGAADFLQRRVEQKLVHGCRTPERAHGAAPAVLPRGAARAALKLVLSRLDAAGVTPFLSFGTLLGAVREGRFIEHDTDIDLGVFSDEASPERLLRLFRTGSELGLALSSLLDGKRVPVKLRHRSGVTIDLVPFERRADSFVTCVVHQHHVLERHRRPFGLRRMDFEGLRVHVPDPPEAFLEENYGDWREPQANYHYVLSSRMPFDARDPLVRYLLYTALDTALARGARHKARWLASEALARGIQGASLRALAHAPDPVVPCASTPR